MYNAQMLQDKFVDKFLDIDYGFFLDIGCGFGGLSNDDPAFYSNTYVLESRNWNGVGIDFDEKYCYRIRPKRKAAILCIDLSLSNIGEVLDSRFCPTNIDYLSLDVDNVQEKVFDELPFDRYRFKVMTIETNLFQNTKSVIDFTDKQRNILLSLGYKFIAKNVKLKGYGIVEDWYYDSTQIQTDQFFENEDCEFIANNIKVINK